MEIIVRHVICKKVAHGDKVLCERKNIHRYATAPLLLKLGAVKNFMTKNAEGESYKPNYYNVQSEYVGNLTNLRFLEQRATHYYMLFTFIVPRFIERYNTVITSPGNAPRWGTYESGLTIFEFWTRFTLSDIKLHQEN